MKYLKYFWLAAAFTVFAVACGGDDDDDKTNTPSPTPTPGTTTLTLSSAFQSNCNTCHPDCEQGTGDSLAGTSLTLAQYTDAIRNGQGSGMAAYSTATYSKADLENDYEYCKAQ